MPIAVSIITCLVTPFFPIGGTLFGLVLSEKEFVKRIRKNVGMRRVFKYHIISLCCGNCAFCAECGLPGQPYIHCFWHGCSSIAVHCFKDLLVDVECTEMAAFR